MFGHKPSAGLIPNTGMWPSSSGEAARMLAIGPLARRAEDLMPLLRIMAGTDGEDQLAVPMELGDPGEVSLDGLSVTVVEDSSVRPIGRDLRDARERAAWRARVRRRTRANREPARLAICDAAVFGGAPGHRGRGRQRRRAAARGGGAVERPALAAVRTGGAHSRDELTLLAESLPSGAATRVSCWHGPARWLTSSSRRSATVCCCTPHS